MAIAYDAIIRGGAGLLFVVFGLVFLLRRPRTWSLALWGLVYVALGFNRLFVNAWIVVFSQNALVPESWQAINVGAGVLGTVAALLLLHNVRRGLSGASRLAMDAYFLVAVLVLTTYYAVYVEPGPDPFLFWLAIGNAYGILALAAAWAGAIESLRATGTKEARLFLLVAFPVLADNILRWASALVSGPAYGLIDDRPIGETINVLALNLVACAPLAWCFRLFGTAHSRLGRVLYLGLIAWTLAFAVYFTFFNPIMGSVIGVMRVLSLAAPFYAATRLDLFQRPFTLPTVRRGTIAAIAVAAFFATAEVAQSVLSDEFGFVLGGAVAGVAVLAAGPVQKAVQHGSKGSADSGNEAAFRSAVRRAFGDRNLSRDEELELLDLAHRLAIPPTRAAAILREEGRPVHRPRLGRAA